MEATVPTYVRNYLTCSRTKAPRDRKYRLLQLLTIPQNRWQDIYTHSIVGLPKSEGYDAMFVVIARLITQNARCTSDDMLGSVTVGDSVLFPTLLYHCQQSVLKIIR